MFLSLKALVSATLLCAAAFGATPEDPEQFAINAQPKGIDVSDQQPKINWKSVVSDGVSYAYIKATEGTSKSNDHLVVQSADITFQTTRVRPTPRSTLEQPKPVSIAAGTIMLFPINPPVLFRPIGVFPTGEAGVTMERLSLAQFTWKVRIMYLEPLRPPTNPSSFIDQRIHMAPLAMA